MKKFKLLTSIFFVLVISLSFQSCSSSDSQEETTNKTTNETDTSDNDIEEEKVEDSSEEAAINFIKKKYAIITAATNYKVDSVTVECLQGVSKIERRSTENGELRYLLENSCGDHGCVTTHHYFWDNNLIFIHKQNYYYAGNSNYMQEYRTYFKNDKMFRCLEKNVSTTNGFKELKNLLDKMPSKTVDCTPKNRTKNLQELIELDIKKAKDFFCETEMPSTSVEEESKGDSWYDKNEHILGEIKTSDCNVHNEKTPGEYDPGTEFKYFASQSGSMCVKVNGEINTMYEDRQEHNYMSDLKKMSEEKTWITIKGTNDVEYFGKSLAELKYEDPVELLTDVILVMGKKEFTNIPTIAEIVGKADLKAINEKVKKIKQEAIDRANTYKNFDLSEQVLIKVEKFDNKRYDVIVRSKLRAEGSTSYYDGKVLLLDPTNGRILDSKIFKNKGIDSGS